MSKKLKSVDGEKTEEKRIGEVTGLTVGQVLQFDQWLQMAIASNSLGTKLHYWATYHAGKTKPIVRAYGEAVQVHKDHAAYVEALRTPGANRLEVEKKFGSYVKDRTELLEGKTDLVIRKVLAEWCMKGQASSAISAALIEYELLEDPEELIDLVYKGEK